jgi:tRNA pseudouridine55 synthase
MEGVYLIDKPRGPTSFDVVAEVRRRVGERRVGHTGTLDPMATGLLPVCVGEACKLVPFLTDCDKRYQAEVVFGVGTTTADAEGEVTETRDASGLREQAVIEAARALTGPIEQIPPMYSAIRVDGRRLHDLARAGQEVERAPRKVVVHALALRCEQPGPAARYRLEMTCSKGTYVRVIAEDLGRRVGLPAHLSQLRRLSVGRFDVEQATPLDALDGATRALTLAEATEHLPTRTLDAAGARRVRAGQERWLLGLADPPPSGIRSRLIGPLGELIAVIFRDQEKIQLERVFVDKGASPKANTPDQKDEKNSGPSAIPNGPEGATKEAT